MAPGDKENKATGQDGAPAPNGERTQERSYEVSRISKPDMFMAVALWMERSPLAQSPSEYLLHGEQDLRIESTTQEVLGGVQSTGSKEESAGSKPVAQETVQVPVKNEPRKFKKSGAVFVLPNDRALSVDCSKEGVHAAVSALNKFGQERAKGCQVYLSRRPCSFCTKLLVQCEVSKVFYLPIEPELDDDDDILRVDTMFKSSSIGLSIKVPRIEESVVQDHDRRVSPYTNLTQRGPAERFSTALLEEYWNETWKNRASEVLIWPAFDENLKEQITSDMKSLMKWIAHTTVKDVPDDIIFVEIQKDHKPKEQNFPGENIDQQVEAATGSEDSGSASDSTPQSSPLSQAMALGLGKRKEHEKHVSSSEKEWQAHALHMSRLAQMLSQRSDDPTWKVGCVLMEQDEVVAIGWNGFPAKALCGEFPSASNTEEERNKKEPYVIHAEQNALLTKNRSFSRDEFPFLFINEVPCRECVPLLIQAGVKKFVIPKLEGPEMGEDQLSGPSNSKAAFKLAFQNKQIDCFGSKRSSARRNLSFQEDQSH